MNNIEFGDCREIMRKWASQGVKAQTCITSPPYYGLRDYGTAKWEGGDGGTVVLMLSAGFGLTGFIHSAFKPWLPRVHHSIKNLSNVQPSFSASEIAPLITVSVTAAFFDLRRANQSFQVCSETPCGQATLVALFSLWLWLWLMVNGASSPDDVSTMGTSLPLNVPI